MGSKLEWMYFFVFRIHKSTVTVKFDNDFLMNFVDVCFSSGISNLISETNSCAINLMINAP